MIDYDLYTPSKFSEAAFEDLMKLIKSSNKFPKYESQKVWLTTSNVQDALLKEYATNNSQFIIAPRYILPTGADAVMLSDNTHIPNRAERRKKQKEECRRNKK